MQLGSIRSWLSFPGVAREAHSKVGGAPRETFERGSAAATEAPSAFHKLTNRVLSWAGVGDLIVPLREELTVINQLEASVQQLTSPAQFAAETSRLKAKLAAGATLESIRNEAYAVARQACSQALGMRPFDAQMLGALAMDRGRIAEMKTGEGKTLTAVMPAYLNALAGKGVHIITANETLAERDCEKMAPVFEMLGLKAQPVLESMNSEQKRDGYKADVTYLTNSTLGFDYLRDKTVRDPQLRVQREPFFALVDEVDEVLIDEARTPLILSQSSRDTGAAAASEKFAALVGQMVAGQDFQVDTTKNSAFLTETGQDRLANQLGTQKEQARLERLKDDNTPRALRVKEAAQQRLATAKQIDQVIRKEQSLEQLQNQTLDKELKQAQTTELELLQQQKQALQKEFPGVNLYHPSRMGQVGTLQNALAARGLYRLDRDYAVVLDAPLEQTLTQLCQQAGQEPTQANLAKWLVAAHTIGCEPDEATIPELFEQASNLEQLVVEAAKENELTPENLLRQVYLKHAELKIVDEFKGRISEGRRFNGGLHQALEAKEGLEVKPEQRTAASITYPNLFGLYPRLAGMSGTAKSSEGEFSELYGLEVAEIPTNKPNQLVKEPDRIFATEQEKLQAIVEEAKRCYEEGIPVLIGTRSVESNQKLAGLLKQAEIPCQCVSAESVKSNSSKENAMLARAGQSGWVTVATNMAGRGVDIKEDQLNYKKAALTASELASNGEQVVVEVSKPEEVERLQQWLDLGDSRGISIELSGQPKAEANHDGWNLPGNQPGMAKHLKLSDFPTGGLRVIGTERHSSPRIDLQLVGRAARQGRPGSAQFFLSLEDELFRQMNGDLPKIEKLDEKRVNQLVRACQERIESNDAEARSETTKFDEPLNLQRKVIDELRGSLVEAAPVGRAEDILATVGEWMDEANPSGSGPLPQRTQLASLVKQLTDLGTFSQEQLADYCRTSMLDAIDDGWSQHLETMESLKDAAKLQSNEEHKPEEIYQKMAFDAFVDFKQNFQAQTSETVIQGLEKTLKLAQRLK
jgi:preprotein translocase subunit SecA